MSGKKRYVSVRIDAKFADAFAKKSEEHGGISEVLRSLIEGFVEDRVSILPPNPPKLFKSFADVQVVKTK